MHKILITGGAGFVGSHLAESAVQAGLKVKVLVHYNSTNNWAWLENSEFLDEIEVISGDIRDFDSVYDSMQGVDTVFHLAALIGIPYSYVSPNAYIKTNIEGTYNILQSAKMHKSIENIIVTSTSETYGSAQYVPMDELHPMIGQSPYSASKIGADNLAISYHRSFGLPVKIVRPFNIYGPRQSARAIIPSIIIQLLNNKTEIKLGNVEPTRDLTYVLDTCDAFLRVGKLTSNFGEYINVGMNQEVSIGHLVELIANLMKVDVKIVQDKSRIRPEKSEVDRLYCDNKKIKDLTGWKPQYSIDKGLLQTIGWLEKHKDLYKHNIYNR